MVRDLQHVRVPESAGDLRLGLALDVAGQQGGEAAGAKLHHERAVVLRGASIGPRGDVSLDRHRTDPSSIAVASEVEWNMARDRGRKKLARALSAELAR